MSELASFLSLTGRRSRTSYALWFVVLIGALLFVGAVVDLHGFGGALQGGTLVACLVAVAASLLVMAQRFRDFGWTGWAVLLVLAPGVGLAVPFVLLFVPGTPGPNRYGPDPLGPPPGAAAGSV